MLPQNQDTLLNLWRDAYDHSGGASRHNYVFAEISPRLRTTMDANERGQFANERQAQQAEFLRELSHAYRYLVLGALRSDGFYRVDRRNVHRFLSYSDNLRVDVSVYRAPELEVVLHCQVLDHRPFLIRQPPSSAYRQTRYHDRERSSREFYDDYHRDRIDALTYAYRNTFPDTATGDDLKALQSLTDNAPRQPNTQCPQCKLFLVSPLSWASLCPSCHKLHNAVDALLGILRSVASALALALAAALSLKPEFTHRRRSPHLTSYVLCARHGYGYGTEVSRPLSPAERVARGPDVEVVIRCTTCYHRELDLAVAVDKVRDVMLLSAHVLWTNLDSTTQRFVLARAERERPSVDHSHDDAPYDRAIEFEVPADARPGDVLQTPSSNVDPVGIEQLLLEMD